MRDLQIYAKRAMEDLNAIGVPFNPIKEFSINTRAKRFGQCKRKDGVYTININVNLLDERVPESSLMTSLYHELIHSVDGCMNHGAKWKSYANLISDCYDVNIERTSSACEKYGKEVYKELLEKRQSKERCFQIRCKKCGNIVTRYTSRTPKWYNHTEQYCCTKCNGRLERI